jgi:thiol:disulfide interchange protein DsbD
MIKVVPDTMRFSTSLMMFILIQGLALMSHATESESEFLPVDEAFSYTASMENNRLLVHWDIADHYYLYQSRIKARQGDKVLDIKFVQTPIEKQDEYFGRVKIFKHQLDISLNNIDNSPIKLSFQGCAEAGLCYPPVKTILKPTDLPTSSGNVDTAEAKSEPVNENDISSITAILEDGSMALQLLIFFALGLGLAFTPCVFPMIPILSSIIVGQGETLTTRRAFTMSLSYVLAMAVTYAVAGVIVGYFGATANISLYLQSPWVLGTFAGIFVLLSLSMFGLYELALPRFIQDKLSNAQQKQQGGSLMSVAIMGSLSALVVSPCVSAPLAGTLVYISTTGDALLGGLALLALGLGMGVPLLIIGTGGGKFLPKAGMWMDGVKNVFGVALLAIAIWLLERVIPASVTLMLWSILLIGSGTFLGAFEQGSNGWKRLFKAMGIILSIYGALLMIGSAAKQDNPLSPLSFLANSGASNSGMAGHTQGAKHTTIISSQEFNDQLQLAAQNNQIVVLDFYADWCIACKVMEKQVFDKPAVGAAMANVLFVQMDMTDNTDDQLQFLTSFDLFGPPAVLFFEDGKELADLRIVGELSEKQFLSTLGKASTSR